MSHGAQLFGGWVGVVVVSVHVIVMYSDVSERDNTTHTRQHQTANSQWI